MQKMVISFIGAGNMASSLIGGLIASGFPAQHIWASNPDEAALAKLKTEFQIHTTLDNKTAASHADVILFCVKPKDISSLCHELRDTLCARQTLVISIATGITTHKMNEWIGQAIPLVRTMPNTPALVGAGMTGMFATQEVTPEQQQRAETILRAVGAILWVQDEAQLDVITAVSGSGPAYFLLFMEALRAAGMELGLTHEESHFLTMQTAIGTARLASESNEEWASLRKKITSPGGTTEQAIKTFMPELFTLCEKAVKAAFNRAKELSQG